VFKEEIERGVSLYGLGWFIGKSFPQIIETLIDRLPRREDDSFVLASTGIV
jgi:hypothetical protein